MYTVYARDSNRITQGVLAYLDLSLRLVYNGIGSWSLTLPADDPKAALLPPGSGIYVLDDETGDVITSGPLRGISEQLAEPDDGGSKETLTFTGVTDEWHLASRLIYPDPTSPADDQSALEYDIRSSNAETVMRNLVSANAGPTALSARQVPGLTLETNLGRGATVNTSSRFDVLADVMAAAGESGGLGWRLIQSGTNLVLHFYEPQDRSATVRFSRELGNLRAYTYSLGGPTATRVIVGGQGEGTARTFVERADTTAETDWVTRAETFRDRRDSNDLPTLQQSGDEELAKSGPTAGLSLSPIDTPLMRFGQHYYLGDLVTVHARSATLVDVLREVQITVDGNGTTVVPTIGSTGAQDAASPKIFALVRDLVRRVGAMEIRR